MNRNKGKSKKNNDMKERYTLTLKRFDMNRACQRYPKNHPHHPNEYGGRNLVFIGMRGIGKSVLVLDYLWNLARNSNNIPIGTCVAPTDEYNMTFEPHIPSRFIFSDFSTDLVKKFVIRQKRIKKKTMKDQRLMTRVDTRAFLIFDDVLHQVKDWANNKDMKDIMCNGRHFDVNFVITSQDPLGGGIPPLMRTNFNFTFICRENKRINREKLFRHWCAVIPDFPMFEQVLKQATNDRGCLVVDNMSTGDEINDCLYVYKAMWPIPKFKLCSTEFWENNDLYKGGDDSDSEEEIDINDTSKDLKHYGGRRSKALVDVNIC